jgi:hypothetical protein
MKISDLFILKKTFYKKFKCLIAFWTLHVDKNFFSLNWSNGYKKIQLFILISKFDLSKKCTLKKLKQIFWDYKALVGRHASKRTELVLRKF